MRTIGTISSSSTPTPTFLFLLLMASVPRAAFGFLNFSRIRATSSSRLTGSGVRSPLCRMINKKQRVRTEGMKCRSSSTRLSSSWVTNNSKLTEEKEGTINREKLADAVKSAEDSWNNNRESLNETHYLPTMLIPSRHIQTMLKPNSPLRPYLAGELFEGVHPRIKVVRNYPTDNSYKLLLLNPHSTTNVNDIATTTTTTTSTDLTHAFPKLDDITIQTLQNLEILPGPTISLDISSTQLPFQTILTKLLPPSAHPPPISFEQIGSVAHFNLKPIHEPFSTLIGQVLISKLGTIDTVVNKIGSVKGPYRTYDMEIMSSRDENKPNPFQVNVSEDGIDLTFDLEKVYWCTRLSGDRQNLLREFKEGDVIADAFCGVGALCIHAASKKGCRVLANDWNPDAISSLKENMIKNGVRNKFVKVECGDARDFIRGLGMMETTSCGGSEEEKHLHVNHLVMNYPAEGYKFLDALRWWPAARNKRRIKRWDDVTTVHVYTFAKADREAGVCAEDVAVDYIAEGLLPEGGAVEKTIRRRDSLDKLGCQVKTREVRDVAPGKVVFCVSFKVTEMLIRHIQGDFIDLD